VPSERYAPPYERDPTPTAGAAAPPPRDTESTTFDPGPRIGSGTVIADTPSLAGAKPTLVVTSGELAGRRFAVDGTTLIGREGGGADITLADPQVSGRHALVRPANGTIEIADLGSTNGTYVNGARLDGPKALADGDVITLGQSALTVELR
ncbi:MAG: FHA domain-containing protein, partial [Thermoleophilia bacterium]|nr:FHA domain-containing protein [Thermoleophilia bacterium]